MENNQKNVNREKDATRSIAAFKLAMLEMVSADPECKADEVEIALCYLRYMSDANPHPFCSMTTLRYRTRLSEAKINNARRNLVQLGYMTRHGVTIEGVVMYKMCNPRAEIVEQAMAECREEVLAQSREEMRKKREKRVAKQKTFPPKIEGGVPRETEGGVPPENHPPSTETNTVTITGTALKSGSGSNTKQFSDDAHALERARDPIDSESLMALHRAVMLMDQQDEWFDLLEEVKQLVRGGHYTPAFRKRPSQIKAVERTIERMKDADLCSELLQLREYLNDARWPGKALST